MVNILVVDDDLQIRMMLKHVLSREGHEVIEAVDGDDALKKISGQSVDLVVTDMIMPNKEGLEIILVMRKKWPDLKIVAMSGGAKFNSFDPLKLAKECGADFIIAKPFQPSELRALLHQCLSGTPAQMSSL